MRVERYLSDQEALVECPHLLQIREYAELLFPFSFEIVQFSNSLYSLCCPLSVDGFPSLLILFPGVGSV